MTPRDVFGIVVRSAGLFVLVSWIYTLLGAGVTGAYPLLAQALVSFFVGVYLLRGAPLLMDMAYGKKQRRGGPV